MVSVYTQAVSKSLLNIFWSETSVANLYLFTVVKFSYRYQGKYNLTDFFVFFVCFSFYSFQGYAKLGEF